MAPVGRALLVKQGRADPDACSYRNQVDRNDVFNHREPTTPVMDVRVDLHWPPGRATGRMGPLEGQKLAPPVEAAAVPLRVPDGVSVDAENETSRRRLGSARGDTG